MHQTRSHNYTTEVGQDLQLNQEISPYLSNGTWPITRFWFHL